MSKKEKILAALLTISTFMLIFSSIYTIYINKPQDSNFYIEVQFKKLANYIKYNN